MVGRGDRGRAGYEGTSIAAVSARGGLPASSVYWHFKHKDDLIAAVIERSFENWPAAQHDLSMANLFAQGQVLAFSKTADEIRGRTVFLQVRDIAQRRTAERNCSCTGRSTVTPSTWSRCSSCTRGCSTTP